MLGSMKPRFVLALGLVWLACLPVRADDFFPGRQDYDADAYRFGLRFEHRRALSGDYDSFNVGTFFWEERWRNFSAGMTIGGGNVDLTPGSFADSETGNPYELELGVFGRYYFAPPRAPLRPYVTASVDIISIGWSYRTPVVKNNGDTVSSDYAQGVGAFTGFGLSVEVSKALHIFGEVGFGAVGMLGQTAEGLDNNLFDSFTYAGVKVGVTFSF